MPAALDLTGHKYGRWTVASKHGRTETNPAVHWRCVCECGQERFVPTRSLRSGASRSCGCLFREVAASQAATLNSTHGMKGTKTHNTWVGMLQRCRYPKNKQYAAYGGRGITVCDRWLSFENFLADMGERPEGLTLDRKDTNGNYEPSNCRWADRTTQSRGQRKTIIWNGRSLLEWSALSGIHKDTLYMRFRTHGTPFP